MRVDESWHLEVTRSCLATVLDTFPTQSRILLKGKHSHSFIFSIHIEMSSVTTLVSMRLRERLCIFTDQIPVVLQLNTSSRCTVGAINYNHKYPPPKHWKCLICRPQMPCLRWRTLSGNYVCYQGAGREEYTRRSVLHWARYRSIQYWSIVLDSCFHALA